MKQQVINPFRSRHVYHFPHGLLLLVILLCTFHLNLFVKMPKDFSSLFFPPSSFSKSFVLLQNWNLRFTTVAKRKLWDTNMFLRLALVFSLFLLYPLASESAVCSIDLGSEWMKVAVVNLKPGQAPIAIAINEMSKRKTPSLVAFHSGSRLIGEEASNLVARYPNNVYSHLRQFISKPYEFTKKGLESLYLNYRIVPDSESGDSSIPRRGVAVFETGEEDGKYVAEEMVAMLLKYAVGLAETHAKTNVKDCVITVPPYMGVPERKGLLAAAELAGINVLALVNEHSGAALQYGIDKDFSNGSRKVIFYNMGASSTYAALVDFSAYNTKEFGKTVSANQFQVKDVRWDAELGGQNMESRLVEYFADEFNKKHGNTFDVRSSAKAMAKLKKQVKRTKEILSANTAAPISVESLYDDLDFRSTISREKFEELCGDIWDRALVPLKEVLEHSGLKIEEVHAVELIGGATRVPKLQTKLQEFLGRKDLDKHLDADEATVLGASLIAANLSDGIKLNRKLGMVDGSTYGFVIELDGPDLVKDENTRQLVVPRFKKLPSKMFRSIVQNKDFDVSLAYESETLIPPGASSLIFAQYALSGLSEAAEKYASRNLSSPIKANLHFSLSRSGIFALDRADAVVEITEWVEVPKKNISADNSTKAAATNSSADISVEDASTNSTEESSEQAQLDDTITDALNAVMNETSTSDIVTERKLKKKTFRVPLKIIDKTTGPAVSLSKELFAESKSKLESLDRKDEERKLTAELKNSLEGYIYTTKEKLESEEFEKISSSEDRQSFLEKLEEVQDWLYMDGEDASASEFQKRLDMLKAIGDPIFFRYTELSARPAALEHARRYLTELQQIIRGWETGKPWLPKKRIDEVVSEAEKVKTWLNDKEAEQKKTPLYSTPKFTSEEVYTKIFNLQDKVASINRIPKPKPKVEKPVKNETVNDGDTVNSTTSSTGEASQNDQTSGASDSSADDKTNAGSESHDEL